VARAQAAHHWPVPPAAWLAESRCITYAESRDHVHDTSNPSSRGLFQFLYSTWERVGGHGDPAAASRAEQTYRAWLIWKQDHDSWSEWSTARGCGLR